MNILVTCPPMALALAEFEAHFEAQGLKATAPPIVQTLSEAELLDLVPDFDGWIVGDDPATAKVFEAGCRGRLRAVVKWGVGVDNVDFRAAERLGLRIANTPGMFGDEVADIAMGYVTGLARETYRVDREVRAGSWPKPSGVSLAGKKVALLGFGNIGRCVARRLLTARMRVVVYDPAYSADSELNVAHEQWPDGIESADFIVLACALTPSNVHMIGAEILARVKRGMRIVNVARGKLINEDALADALESGRVHSAALEVFETEPLIRNSRLRTFDRCIFGSHNGSNTAEAVRQTSERAIELLCQFLARPPG